MTTFIPNTAPAKGEQFGACARTACVHLGATHFNRVTRGYYCTPCARKINESAAQSGMEPLCDWPAARGSAKEPWNFIHASNLELALSLAIEAQKQRESIQGYTRQSAFVSGLESNLAALQAGKTLVVK